MRRIKILSIIIGALLASYVILSIREVITNPEKQVPQRVIPSEAIKKI